jgi:type IV pilus assembly protein PilO
MQFNKLYEMPWYLRFMIFAVIAVLFYGGFWYFVTKGTRAETNEISTQVDLMRKQNQQAQIASQRLNNFRAQYKARQEEYEELKSLLPEQRELTSVLEGVQDRTREQHLTLKKFTPKDDIQQDFYSGKPIEIQVNSTFQNLRGFFDLMARYQRIVSITDFKISRMKSDESLQDPGKTVNAQFLLTAYYVSSEKLQGSNPASAQNPPAAPAPAKQ